MSSFSKKVMIDSAELDRMQQSQIRNYSPELHSLSQLHNQMINIIADKSMSADKKLNLLSSYEGRFNKLKKETGVLVGSVPADTDEDTPAIAAPQVTNQAIALPDGSASDDADSPDQLISTMGIQPMYRNKARKLLIKIRQNPSVLTYNKKGEIIVKGKTVPGSDFSSLFQSMVGPKPDLKQQGTESFMGALHEIRVKPLELSGKAVQSKYTQIKYRHAKEAPDENKNEPEQKPISSSKKPESSTSRQKKPVPQKGQGVKRKSSIPPGTHPKILYVY